MIVTTTHQDFTFTENMTVTFVFDWGVIQVPVDADTDDLMYLVNAADDVLTDYLVDPTHAYEQANEVYVTNSHGETVEV